MNTNDSLFGSLCRAAALSFLVAGSTLLVQAQQSVSGDEVAKAPLLISSASSLLDLTASSSSSSSSDSNVDSHGQFMFSAAALNSAQPPPRRYGRPRYSGGNTNADGSSKFAFMAGAGTGLPVGNTKKYETLSYAFQAGVGRNWNKNFGVMMQFDYDHFGLQGATIANQGYIYNYCTIAENNLPPNNSGYCFPAGPAPAGTATPIDGSNHVWSFTLNPTFTLATEGSVGAYFVAGAGFYHKVTDFTTLATGRYYDPCCGYIQYQANQVFDHYSSNAPGFNGGIGLTYKLSQFSNERLYIEARYVVMMNSQRHGITTANIATAPLSATDYYPANSNRTGYVPITVGIRF